jgi:chromosome segregation ATPase
LRERAIPIFREGRISGHSERYKGAFTVDKQVVFKTSTFGGFDKKAVLDYVYALNQRAEEAQARMEEQLKEAVAEKDALAGQLESARIDAQNLRGGQERISAELSGERQRINELGELVTSLNDEIRRLKEELLEKDSEVAEFARINNELLEKNRGLEQTRAEVEHASSQIGKLLINANAEADNVVAAANSRAGEILAETRVRADDIVAEADVRAKDKLSAASVQADRMTDGAQRAVDEAYERFSVFKAEVSGLQKTMLSLLEDIHIRAGEINDSIDSAQEILHEVSRPIFTAERGELPEEDSSSPEEILEPDEEDGDFFRVAAED